MGQMRSIFLRKYPACRHLHPECLGLDIGWMRPCVDKKGQLIAVNCEGSSVRCDHAARVTGVVTLACTLFATVLCRFSLYASESIWSPSSRLHYLYIYIKRQKAHASQPPIFNGLIVVGLPSKRQKAAFSHVEKIENIECRAREGQTRENVKCHRPLRAPLFLFHRAGVGWKGAVNLSRRVRCLFLLLLYHHPACISAVIY